MNTINLAFLKSALTIHTDVNSLQEIIDWVHDQNMAVTVEINEIPFNDLNQWSFKKESGSLIHDSGKFFSIDGMSVRTNWGAVPQWDQPIINQPEIGYLGFIASEINGVLHFLMQAKIEPGNVNFVQISPTLQATKSNYTQAHKGKVPLYLEYFQNATSQNTLVDQLQSEQGARFLKKRNRNIIVKTEIDVPVYDNFKWMTLGQIKQLMKLDNVVNMDTRTVVSCIPFGSSNTNGISLVNFLTQSDNESTFGKKVLTSFLDQEFALHTIDNIIGFITGKKSYFDLVIKPKHLSDLNDWIITDNEIKHVEGKFFKVIAADVKIENREVINWTQPMVQPAQEGLCAFVCKEINDVLHFAVQTKLECGNFDVIELAPTVQCLTGNYRQISSSALPFLNYVLNVDKSKIVIDAIQSEEGGRFYKEQNRNLVILAGAEIGLDLPENFIWMTLNQLQSFMKYNNYLNIQARGLISSLPLN